MPQWLSRFCSFHRTLQNLSFDVLIAVASCFVFIISVTNSSTRINVSHWTILLSSIWCLYTLDHLMDAKNSAKFLGKRHLYHKRNTRNILLVLVFIVLLLATFTAISFSQSLILKGFALFLFAMIHLLFVQKSKWYPKEMIASFVLNIGIWFFVLQLSPWENSYTVYFILTWIVILLNMLCYSFYDYQDDMRNNCSGLFCILNARKLILITYLLAFFAALSYFLLSLLLKNLIIYYSLLSLLIIPVVIMRNFKLLKLNEKYRSVGDYSFILLAVEVILRN